LLRNKDEEMIAELLMQCDILSAQEDTVNKYWENYVNSQDHSFSHQHHI
jgi:hypothetical protein